MYLIYIDESGLPRGKQDEHFVLSGLALHEEDCYPLARSLEAVQRRILPGPNSSLELHASRIFSGRFEWSHVDQMDRTAILDDAFDLLSNWVAPSGRRPVYFGTVIHKPSFPGKSAVEVAYNQTLARFDTFLDRLHRSGDSHRSLVISDKSQYEKVLQQVILRWQEGDGGIRKLHSLVEVPLFVDSKASRLVQAVDLVAWATFNYYERGHDTYFGRIHPRFDAQDGVQHGLVHLVKGYKKCSCAPCDSRRNYVIPAAPSPWSEVERPGSAAPGQSVTSGLR